MDLGAGGLPDSRCCRRSRRPIGELWHWGRGGAMARARKSCRGADAGDAAERLAFAVLSNPPFAGRPVARKTPLLAEMRFSLDASVDLRRSSGLPDHEFLRFTGLRGPPLAGFVVSGGWAPEGLSTLERRQSALPRPVRLRQRGGKPYDPRSKDHHSQRRQWRIDDGQEQGKRHNPRARGDADPVLRDPHRGRLCAVERACDDGRVPEAGQRVPKV